MDTLYFLCPPPTIKNICCIQLKVRGGGIMSIYSDKYGSYDKGRKEIARAWGLTGIQAGHLADKLERKGYDYQSFDFGGTTGEVKDYGKGHARYQGAKKFLKDNYGVLLDDPWDRLPIQDIDELQWNFNQRSPRSIAADQRRVARKTYKPKNKKGVDRWWKHMNRYDIEGVDTPPGFEL
jgi:hypothetical protein